MAWRAILPVCGAVIGKERSMKKIAVVASAVLMSMGLGMAGAQQTSSVEQNKKGVVMKGFVQDIPGEGGRKRAPLLEQRGSLQVAFMPKRRQPRSCFYLGMNRCRCQRPSTRMDGGS